MTQLGPQTTPLTTRLLQMIALFEGSQAGAINVWDEQYLSVGTLHYAVRGGSGYQFLSRVQAIDPAGFQRCLGPNFAQATRSGHAGLTNYCRLNVWQKPRTWSAAFRNLALLPAYAQADRECARPYLLAAIKIARYYNLTSERGLAFALDRAVQQGPSIRLDVNRALGKIDPALPEFHRMKLIARAYAACANPKYKDTVLKRSLTVALGSTALSGYPGNFTLQGRFNLAPDRAWAGQVDV